MRKAAKRARAFSKQPSRRRDSTRGARKRVKKVRSLLGDHQDTVLARPVLRQLGCGCPKSCVCLLTWCFAAVTGAA
jgi:CHAD domain-containing protein